MKSKLPIAIVFWYGATFQWHIVVINGMSYSTVKTTLTNKRCDTALKLLAGKAVVAHTHTHTFFVLFL